MKHILRTSMIGAATLALGIAGCSKPAKQASASADLQRDLKLASTSSLDLASEQSKASFPLTEIPVESKPQRAPTIKKAPGPKAVRSPRPTVKAAPEPEVAAATETQQVATTEPAPAPVEQNTPEPAAPAVPRPSPVPVSAPSGGRSTGDDGVGAVMGGIIGVIIRGGGVDGDNCEPHGRGRPHGGVFGGGIYGQPPMGRGGIYGRPGPFPINPMVTVRPR